jgi:hypothetical protein
MSEIDFKIVFDKLAASESEDPAVRSLLIETRDLRSESQEIAELRQLILELAEPEPLSYTTT